MTTVARTRGGEAGRAPVESEREGVSMANVQKRPSTASKPGKKASKRHTYRDVPPGPTAKQIEQSINRGTSVPLTDFVKGVKL